MKKSKIIRSLKKVFNKIKQHKNLKKRYGGVCHKKGVIPKFMPSYLTIGIKYNPMFVPTKHTKKSWASNHRDAKKRRRKIK